MTRGKKTLADHLLSYAAYHCDTRNKITHFFGVPLVVYSLFVPMGWFRFVHADIPLTGATLFFLATLIHYLRLDVVVALLVTPATLVLLWLADKASLLPFWESLGVFVAAFVGGWIIQLLGHVFEGRRPALVDNIMQIFNAPLFLVLEVMFLLGFRKELKAKVAQLEKRRSAA